MIKILYCKNKSYNFLQYKNHSKVLTGGDLSGSFFRLRADTWILNQDWILNPESKENTAYMPTLPDTQCRSQTKRPTEAGGSC